jgi:hypothetical protein
MVTFAKKVTAATNDRHLCGIAFHHRQERMPDPTDDPEVALTLRGSWRFAAKSSRGLGSSSNDIVVAPPPLMLIRPVVKRKPSSAHSPSMRAAGLCRPVCFTAASTSRSSPNRGSAAAPAPSAR